MVLEAVEQGELVEEDGAEGEAAGPGEAARGDGAVGVEDALELAVEVLDGERAELVEDAADLDAVVGVRVGAPAGGDQEAAGAEAMVADGRVVVVGVAEDEPRVEWAPRRASAGPGRCRRCWPGSVRRPAGSRPPRRW